MGKMIELTASDGHRLAAYRADPQGTPRGAIVVIQEIFGVNDHIRSVADGFAADGYVALAPAMYDRVQRGYETGYAQDDIQAGLRIMQGLDWKNTMNDVAAAVAHAGTCGKVGIVGYCWGGTVTWVAAARTPGLACAVPYYGGGMANFIGEKPRVPVLCHFGELDKNPSPEQAKQLLSAHPEVQAHFYNGAGHGFNCNPRPSYHADASAMARERTLAFFRQHVG